MILFSGEYYKILPNFLQNFSNPPSLDVPVLLPLPTDPTDLQEVPVEAVPGLTALPAARPAAVSRRGGSAHGDVPPQTDTD